MHDCNRHRNNGYRDKTWVHRIPEEAIETFQYHRETDRDRK